MNPAEKKKYYEDKIKKQLELEANFDTHKKRISYANYGIGFNEAINEERRKEHKTSINNINNTKEQPDSKNFNFTLPEINVNLGSVTINDEKKIKEISSQVGRETDEALAAALMTQFITQK